MTFDRDWDVIVVLGGRILPDGRCGPATHRRVEAGARAYRAGVAPNLIVAGGRRWHGHIEAVSMASLLQRLGVPEDVILLEPFSFSTSENALFSTRLGRLWGWRRYAVATCPWHLKRAIHDFRLCGVEVRPLAAQSAPRGKGQRLYRPIKEQVSMGLDYLRLRKGLGS